MFTADARKLLQCKEELVDALGNVEERKRKFCLFRTVECRDVAKLLRTKKFTMDALIGSSQSLEVVEQRDPKPLIRAK